MAENAVDRALAVFRAYEKRGVAGVAAPKTRRTFNDLAVATPYHALGVTGVAKNNVTKSSGSSSATPVTRATPENKQPQKSANLGSFPFGEVLDQFERCCPDHIEAERWRQCIADASRFIASWGDNAAALGWTTQELFGLHRPPANPHPTYRRLSRYDATGLIWLLQGRPVAALTADTAAIATPSGGALTYCKLRKPAFGPIGDSLDDMED